MAKRVTQLSDSFQLRVLDRAWLVLEHIAQRGQPVLEPVGRCDSWLCQDVVAELHSVRNLGC